MENILGILKKAEGGKRISPEESLELFDCHDLVLLGHCANKISRRKNGNIISYIVDRNINYTNICNALCKFCAFSKDVNDPNAYLLSYEDIERKTKEAVLLGGTQILLQGGLNPEIPFKWYIDLISKMKSRFPQVIFHAFSPPEILNMSKISGLTIIDVVHALKEAGWQSMPGGGAEILSESTRIRMGKNKITTKMWLEIMEICHKEGINTTATMMFGHIETKKELIEHLNYIRETQDRTSGFRAFIPWTFQPGNTPLSMKIPFKATAFDYLKTLSISRIFLDNFRNIQGSWVTMGKKIGQLSLFFGANDLGSTMIEENVVAAAGCTNRMDETDIIYLIKDAGLSPFKRDTFY
ncbi:MAG: cyclic dehypoxanthinyl futalosine synthase, partial [Thermodesulfobacteriota bacterium]|nr:cyclic dehypoxanthinyl futalosine synthase [Thermodesulfobacteriota bacterium]